MSNLKTKSFFEDRLITNTEILKKFGITMGIAFLVITLFIFIRHRHSAIPTSAISLLFFSASLIAPVILNPIYIIWMRLAFILSWVNTRLILMIVFYLIFTPIGLLMRIFGKDLLDRKIEKSKGSYWHKKEYKKFNPLDYERQF